MTVEPHSLEQFLPEDPQKPIKVTREDNGLDAFPAVRREILALIHAGMVEGIANKHGYLRCVRLLVPVGAAMGIVRRYRRPPVASNLTITRPVQNGMHFKQRADQAQSSRASRVRFRWVFDRVASSTVPEEFADKWCDPTEGGVRLVP